MSGHGQAREKGNAHASVVSRWKSFVNSAEVCTYTYAWMQACLQGFLGSNLACSDWDLKVPCATMGSCRTIERFELEGIFTFHLVQRCCSGQGHLSKD